MVNWFHSNQREWGSNGEPVSSELITTLQMFASRVQPGLQILSAANFVCNLCNRYLKLLQLFASAVLWCKHSCMYLQSLQIKVAYLTTKVSCNHWLQQLHPECNWTRNTSKSCSFGNQNIYSAMMEISYFGINLGFEQRVFEKFLLS